MKIEIELFLIIRVKSKTQNFDNPNVPLYVIYFGLKS